MPTKMVRQTMFNSGQVDEVTWKRTDVDEYLTSAQLLLNSEVGTTGLAKKRKPTQLELIATTYAVLTSKMYEFLDKNGNYYIVIISAGSTTILTVPTPLFQVVDVTPLDVVIDSGADVVANSGGVSFFQTFATPYTASDLSQLDYSQDNDTLILTHPKYPPARIYVSDYSTLTFAFEYLDIYPLPAYDFNTINYNGFTVSLSVSGDVLTFAFTGVGADPGFTNAWVGGQIIGGGATDTDPIGYAIITAVSYSSGGGGVTTFTATVQIPFLTSGYATQGSQFSVRQPAWSSTTTDTYGMGYPEKVLFFQNRLWLANTKTLNNTIFGSKINTPVSFDVGTGRDTDAIIYTIGQATGDIYWLNGGKQLEVFTQLYEFSCPQDQNSGLTPSNFSIRQQSSYGASSFLKPQTYINDTYYASKTGKAFINYHFTGVGLSYNSSNISLHASNLIKAPTNRALLRGADNSQDNFVYLLNPSDNTLTSFQFALEYKLAAFSPITFQANVTLVDIVTVANEVYLLKYYSLTQVYTIEKFIQTGSFIDSQQTASMASTGVVTGLDRFNGYTVQVVYKNQDFGEYLVVAGQITVDNPNLIADTVFIGILYQVEMKPMFLFADTAAAPFKKQITAIYVDYYQSLDFYINGKLVPYQNFADIQAGLPLQPQTGTATIYPVHGWNQFETFSITQSSPFDLQILSIGYQIDVAVI